MAILTHTSYFERWCIPCAATTVHRVFISSAGGELITIARCMNCGKPEGRITS